MPNSTVVVMQHTVAAFRFVTEMKNVGKPLRKHLCVQVFIF